MMFDSETRGVPTESERAESAAVREARRDEIMAGNPDEEASEERMPATRYARFARTPNGILDGNRMRVHGSVIPASARHPRRYMVTFLDGMLAGCDSVANETDVIFDDPHAPPTPAESRVMAREEAELIERDDFNRSRM